MNSHQFSQGHRNFVQVQKSTNHRALGLPSYNNQYFDTQSMLPLYSTNANSVNPNQLIFRAREIYEKYRKHDTQATGFSTQAAHHRHQQIINTHGHQTPRDAIDPEHEQTSIKGSFSSDFHFQPGPPKNINNEIKTAETVASITNILPKNSSNESDKLKNFLYVMVGIFSCHIRVNQRFGLQNIQQFQRSVKNYTDFCAIIQRVIRKKINLAITMLKQNKNQNIWRKNTIQHHEKGKETKTTRADSPQDSNFAMEQSTVEKGLKFLQQRSNQRKKLQQKMRNSQYMYIRKQPQHERLPNFQQKQEPNSRQASPSMGTISNSSKSGQVFQFNHNIQKKPVFTRQNQVFPPTSPSHETVSSKIALPGANKPVESQEADDIYLKLQKESKSKNKNSIKPSWLSLQLNQKPLLICYEKETDDQLEINQRRYYLNPNTFKGAEPDRNEGFMPLLSHFGYDVENDSMEDHEAYKKTPKKTLEANLEDTLPIFDPLNNQNATRSWEPPQNFIQQMQKKNTRLLNSNLRSVESSGNKHSHQDQKQFENLPSFNQKNKINIKSELLSSKRKKYQQQNQVNIDQGSGERARGKSEFIANKNDSSSGKFSQEDHQFILEEKMQKNQSKDSHNLDEYNINRNYSNKNIVMEKKQNVKTSFDYAKNKKGKRPISRPKSLTYSIGNQGNKKQEKQQYFNTDKATPNASQNTSSHNTELSQQRPKVTINYQSPPKDIQMTRSIHLGPPSPQINFQPMHQQPPQRIIFQRLPDMHRGPYFNYNPIQNYQPIQANNKQIRAISSEARFFGSKPIQGPLQMSITPSHQSVRPRVQTNYLVHSPRNSPIVNSVTNQHNYFTGQQSLKLIRPAPIVEAYGLASVRHIPQVTSAKNIIDQSPQGFQKKKWAQMVPQQRLSQSVNKNVLSRYNSDKRIELPQDDRRPAKAQVPNLQHHHGRKIHVVSAQYN